MSTKTRRLRKTLVVLVAIALMLAPNLITFADGAEGAQGTPTPEATVEASAQQSNPTPPPSDEEEGEQPPVPASEETGEEATPTPTPSDEEGGEQPPVPASEEAGEEATPTPTPSDEEGGEQPPVPASEEASEEVTPAPTPSSEEASEEVTPEPTPSDEEGGEQLPPSSKEQRSGEATPTPTPVPDAKSLTGGEPMGSSGFSAEGSGAWLTIKNVKGDKKYTVTYTTWVIYHWAQITDDYSPGSRLYAKKGTSVTITAQADDNYAFSKWKKPSGSNATVSFTMPNSNYTAEAEFARTHYELELGGDHFLHHYIVNFGSGDINKGGNASIDVPVNASVSVTAYAKDGRVFTKWNTSPGNKNQNPTTFTMDRDHEVDAEFETLRTYDLDFINVSGLQNYTYSWTWRHSWDILGIFARSGNGTANGGDSVSFYKGADITVGVNVVSGAEHKGWKQPSTSSASTIDIALSGNKRVEADIEETVMYTLTFNGTRCGYSIGDGNTYRRYDTVQIEEGTQVSVTVLPDTGYAYDGWDSTPGTNANPTVFTMDGDKSVDAKIIEAVKYTLTFEGTMCYYMVEGDSTHYVGGQSKQIEEGTEVKVTTYPDAGYYYAGWDYTPGTNANPTVFTMDEDCAVNSNIQRSTYDISFVDTTGLDHYSYTVNGGASTDINGGQSATFNPDDVVVVTAHEKALYSFSSWDGSTNADSTSGADATYTMNSDKTAKALFNDDGYHLNLYMTGNLASYTVVIGSDTYTITSDTDMHLAKDAGVSVTANPKTGKVFDYWKGDAPTASRNGNLWSFTMDDDYWVKAYCTTLSGEKFKVIYDRFSPGTGSGEVEVFYNGSSQGTLSPGGSVEITYVRGVDFVTVVAIPSFDPNCRFVSWTNHGNVTSASMDINLVTGQGSPTTRGISIECVVTVDIVVKPEFERLGSLELTKVDELFPFKLLDGAQFTLSSTALGYSQSRTTSSGKASWTGLREGTYTLTETQAPNGYEMPLVHTWTVKVGPGGGISTECVVPEAWDLKLTVENKPVHCSLTVKKVDSEGELIGEAVFELFDSSNNSMGQKTTSGGTATWDDLDAGVYTLKEISAPNGYYWETETHNVTLTPNTQGWPEFEKEVENLKYVKIVAKKMDINTGAVLSGAKFAIFNTDGNGQPTTQIGNPKTTNSNGIVRFGYGYKLKHGVTYWIKEIEPPTGYQNDAATATGYAVTIDAEGTTNQASPVLFENTPLLQQITVVKSFMEVAVSDIGGGFLDGVEFELYEGANPGPSDTPIATKTLTNGTCVFDNLLPGTYTIKEVDGPITKYIEVASDKEVTLELAEVEGQNTNVNFDNFIDEGAFKFVKHDSLTEATLAGATYRLTGMHWNGSEFVLTSYEMTTGSDGSAQVTGLTPGMYTFQEITPPAGYDIDTTVYDVEILPGRTTEDVEHYFDDPLGSIMIAKKTTGTDARIFGARFQLYRGTVAPENAVGGVVTTDPNGNAWWTGLPAGTYVVYEVSAPSGYVITTRSTLVELAVGEDEVITIYNDSTTTTTPPIIITPEPTPYGPEATPTPSPTPIPTATPTPIASDELTIEDVDPAFGPETGEGDGLFMTIGILLLMAAALFVIRKRTVIRTR